MTSRTGLATTVVCLIAAVPLFWDLGDRYLWQDEAATAVLGERLMKHGRPLGYDGRNLITMDIYTRDLAALAAAAESAESGVRFFVERGDFKPDTTWIGAPWGQFLAAGLSLELLGRGTLQARIPFALMALATVIVLFRFVRARFDDPFMAAIAVAILMLNAYWLIHMRQSRYYAGSSLFLLLTFAAYLRWKNAGRFGAPLYIASSWSLFQFDFGTFWPVTAVLLVDSLRAGQGRIRETATVAATLGAAVLPFALFYELAGRLKPAATTWEMRAWANLFLLNQFVAPLLLLLVAAVLVVRSHDRERAGMIGVALALIAAMAVWVPIVSPSPFLRYSVNLAPIAALVIAWVVVLAARAAANRNRVAYVPVALALVALISVSPWPSNAVAALIPSEYHRGQPGRVVRSGLRLFAVELSGGLPDPNRELIEYVRERLRPDDELLVSYEDIPFMFYTNARIRGGIPGFRVRDRTAPFPRMVVLRPSAYQMAHIPMIRSEMARYRWRETPLVADSTWGNIPDPALRPRLLERSRPRVRLAIRTDTEGPPKREE